MKKDPIDFSLVFGSAVHDIKNSVGMLLHSLEEFLENNPPKNAEDRNRSLTLNYEASRINSDLMQLLSIYRLQTEKIFVSLEENHIAEFLEDEIIEHDTLLDMKNIAVEIACDDNILWCFDTMLIKIVMHNILINTIRYTRDKIRIAAEINHGKLCISVEDNGDGFPQELRDNPGNYLGTIDFNTGSTGLGLYFSSRVAELHRYGKQEGHIELDNNSSLGGGVFRIFLP